METEPNLPTSPIPEDQGQPLAEIIQFPESRIVPLNQVQAETAALTRFRRSVPEGELGVRVWLKEHKTGVAVVGSAAAVAAALGALGIGAHMLHKHRQNK